MKGIEVFYLSRMNQQRAFWFFKQIINKISRIDDKRFQSKLRSFTSAFSLFEKTLHPDESILVDKIEEESSNCDVDWMNLKEFVSQILSDPHSEYKNIGKAVQKIIEKHEDPTTLSGIKKIDSCNDIVRKIEDSTSMGELYRSDIFDLLSRIKRASWAYKQYHEARNIELTGKRLTRESLDARKNTELEYYSIIEFLNAMFIYKGEEGYEQIIDDVNNIINMGKSTPIIFDINKEDHAEPVPEREYDEESEAFSA